MWFLELPKAELNPSRCGPIFVDWSGWVPHQVEPRQRPWPSVTTRWQTPTVASAIWHLVTLQLHFWLRAICHSVPIRSCTRMIPSEVWPRNTKYAYLSSTRHLLDPRDQSPADQVVGSACDGRGAVWVRFFPANCGRWRCDVFLWAGDPRWFIGLFVVTCLLRILSNWKSKHRDCKDQDDTHTAWALCWVVFSLTYMFNISARVTCTHTHTHSSNDCFGLYLLSFVSAFQVFSRDDMQTAWDIFRKDLYGPDLTVWLCRHSRSVTTLHVMVGKKQSLSRDAFHLLQALIIQRSKFRDELYWVSQPLYSRCFVGTVYLQILSHQSEAGCFWPYG